MAKSKSKKRPWSRQREKRNRSVRVSSEKLPVHVPVIVSSINNNNNEIQEQLERQRRKRRSAESSDGAEPRTAQEVMGNFEYDPETNAYFPKHSNVSHQKKKQQEQQPEQLSGAIVNNMQYHQPKLQRHWQNFISHDKCPIQRIPTFMIGHVGELCSTPRRYQTLRAHWTGRIFVDRMKVVPSARRGVDSRTPMGGQHVWELMLLQLQRRQTSVDGPTSDMPWDLVCKTHLHSSSRTFDVQQTSSDYSRFPDIATLVEGGTFMRLGDSSPPLHHMRECLMDTPQRNSFFWRDTSQFMNRFAPRNSDDSPSIAVLTSSRPGTMDMMNQRPDSSNVMRVDISRGPCNDLAFHPLYGKGNCVIAVAPCITPKAKQVTIYSDILYGESFHMKTCAFSRSDALCVDFLNENSILFGHRNGLVSLCDTRTKQMQPVAAPQCQLGSTTSLLSLSDGWRLLAKKSFGPCYMFDIRKMSARKDAAIVWHLPVSSEKSNPTLSACCSGLAVDPTQTFAVSPFADSDRRCHFAVWSLTNGQLLGSKPCQKATPLDSVEIQSNPIILPHIELCSTITPSWQLDTDQVGKGVVKRKSNAWSLWFKSGQVDPQAPGCVGSIHQLTFRGGTDPFEH